MKTKKTPAEKLAYKLNRLAKPGYYVRLLKNPLSPVQYHDVIYIAPNAKCHYVHHMGNSDWCTLTWSCAPTKGMVQGNDRYHDYAYYATWADLCANACSKIPPQATAAKPTIDVTP